ncbi:MAG: hypothetical protein ABFD97_20500 [Syntrophobacter sp.]
MLLVRIHGNGMVHRYLGKVLLLLLAIVFVGTSCPYSANPGGDGHEEELPLHQCGCPREKVASHTCCCTLAKKSCCAPPSAKSVSANMPIKQTSATPILCHPSCSPPEQLTAGSSTNTKSVVADYQHEVFTSGCFIVQVTETKPENVFLEVLVPPPKASASSPS